VEYGRLSEPKCCKYHVPTALRHSGSSDRCNCDQIRFQDIIVVRPLTILLLNILTAGSVCVCVCVRVCVLYLSMFLCSVRL